MTYELVSGDTAPQIQATITRDDTGAVVNLTGATVRMYFRKKGTTTTLFTLVSSTGSFSSGIATFAFATNDLATIAEGYYEGEIEITYADASKETIFKILNFYIRSDF